jgi:type I site-specific restriction endonuclease
MLRRPGNDVRARLVVNEWRRLASHARRSRAIVFCVSVAHAELMTRWLNKAVVPFERPFRRHYAQGR